MLSLRSALSAADSCRFIVARDVGEQWVATSVAHAMAAHDSADYQEALAALGQTTRLAVFRRGRCVARTPAATAQLSLPDRPAQTAFQP